VPKSLSLGDALEDLVNRYSTSELAGVCFSRDGKTLFLKLFGKAENR
jgi:uncharacterized protein